MLHSAELPVKKLNGSPNVADLSRTLGTRASVRSIDKNGYEICDYNYATTELPAGSSLRSLDRGIHSSHSSIDRKCPTVEELSLRNASRVYEPTLYGRGENAMVGRDPDQASMRSYSLRRGSNLSLRIDENAGYGGVERESRRGSDASLLAIAAASTLPMQRRPFHVSNEYGIANISESE